jgi:hypothetical protein
MGSRERRVRIDGRERSMIVDRGERRLRMD